jgi:hypothetical protein
MSLFYSMRIKNLVEVEPELLSDPEKAIKKSVTRHLLNYSHKIQGIPVAFTIEGVVPQGRISEDDGAVLLSALVNYAVLKIPPGGRASARNGYVFGVFFAVVDGDNGHTGSFTVERIIPRGRHSFTIIGTSR